MGVGCGGEGPKTPDDRDEVPVEDDTAIGLGQGGRAADPVQPADHDIEVPPAP